MRITPFRHGLVPATAAAAGLLVLGSVSVAAAGRSVARAVPITASAFAVDTTADPVTGASCSTPGSGLCSLRAALAAASLVPAGGVVTFAVGGPFHIRAPLAVSQGTVTVQGRTDGSTVIEAGPSGRLITAGDDSPNGTLTTPAVLTLERLVLTGGHASPTQATNLLDGFGGAVLAGPGSTLTIADSHLHDNTAGCGGGAVAAFNGGVFQGGLSGGAVTITRTTIDHNSAGAACGQATAGLGGLVMSGGALWTFGLGATSIINSTLAANSSRFEGSAITDLGGLLGPGGAAPLTLTGDTVAGNTATSAFDLGIGSSNGGAGAGKVTFVPGAAILSLLPSGNQVTANRAATLAGPSAALTRAFGLSAHLSRSSSQTLLPTGVMTLTNTLLDNPGGSCRPLAVLSTGLPVDGTGNLATDATCNLSTASKVADLKIESSLHDNGGFAPTLGLLTGSPAFGAGTNAACTDASGSAGQDERGVPRPQGAQCDSGAVEPAATTSSLSIPSAVLAGTPFPLTATISTVSPLAFEPTGTATVTEGATTIGTLALAGRAAHRSARSAVFTLSDTLAPGTHILTVNYAGTPGFLASTGRLQVVVATPATPTPIPAAAVAAISAVPTTGAGGFTPVGPILVLAGIGTLGALAVRRRR